MSEWNGDCGREKKKQSSWGEKEKVFLEEQNKKKNESEWNGKIKVKLPFFLSLLLWLAGCCSEGVRKTAFFAFAAADWRNASSGLWKMPQLHNNPKFVRCFSRPLQVTSSSCPFFYAQGEALGADEGLLACGWREEKKRVFLAQHTDVEEISQRTFFCVFFFTLFVFASPLSCFSP